MHELLSIDETARRISEGKALILAGDEAALARLPRGTWIGGTTPYFMTDRGGLHARDRVFATEAPVGADRVAIVVHDAASLSRLYTEIPEHGYGVVLMPLFSRAELAFAVGAPDFEGFASRPLVGWVAGVDASDAGRLAPRVYDGRTGRALTQEAVAMYVTLPASASVEIGIVNVFTPSAGDLLRFPEAGFSAREVEVGGERRDLVDYLADTGLDIRRPLVGEYGGAGLNVGIREVDAAARVVRFWSPVFPGIGYRHAAPVADYVGDFLAKAPPRFLAAGTAGLAFCCNCFSNYSHGQLEGRRTGPFVGPIVFGEIAYQLCNETLVYLSLTGLRPGERR
jgi:hypothetical protein